MDQEKINLTKPEQFVVDCLRKEFSRRLKKNPSYSIRSFAHSLKIDQSYLTKVIHGKINLSQKMVFHLSSCLNIKPQILKEQLVNYEILEDDKFEVISNWIHFAILELMKVKDFQSTPTWIAKKLDVHTIEVEDAINRLCKLEILSIDPSGELIIASQNFNWNNDAKTTYARKTLQKVYLQQAIEAIDSVDFSERENSSLTVSIPVSLLPELKKEIQNFKNKIDRLCESQSEKNEVYQLCIALFPVLKSKEDL